MIGGWTETVMYEKPGALWESVVALTMPASAAIKPQSISGQNPTAPPANAAGCGFALEDATPMPF